MRIKPKITAFMYLLGLLVWVLEFTVNQSCTAQEILIQICDFQASQPDSVLETLQYQIPDLLAAQLHQNEHFKIQRVSRRHDMATNPADVSVNALSSNDTVMVRSLPTATTLRGLLSIKNNLIHLALTLVSTTSASQIGQYTIILGPDSSRADFAGEMQRLSEKITHNVLEKRTPFGFPFNETDSGVLICDFGAATEDSGWAGSPFSRLLGDSLNQFLPRAQMSSVRVNLIRRQVLENYFSTTTRRGNHQLARQLGQGLNAKLVIWAEVPPARQEFKPRLTILDTLFQLPTIETARLAPFAPALHPGHLDFPALPVAQFFDVVKGWLYYHHQQYDRALAQWRNLYNQQEFDLAHTGLCFYTGTSDLLLGRQVKADWGAAQAAWKNARRDYHKLLNMKSPAISNGVEAMIYNNLGLLNQLVGQSDSAAIWFRKSAECAQRSHLKFEFFRTQHNLANIFLLQGEWHEALKLYQSMVVAGSEAPPERELAILYDNIGLLYQRLEKIDLAQVNFEKSLTIKQNLPEAEHLAASYLYLANIFQTKGEWDRALEYYLKNLEWQSKQKNSQQIAQIYRSIGEIHRQKGNLNLALEYFLKRAELIAAGGDNSQVITTNMILADIYQQKNDWHSALEFLEKAQRVCQEQNDETNLGLVLDKISDIYQSQRRYDEALVTLQYATRLFRKTQQFERLSLATFNMGLVHLRQQNYQAAYDLIQQAIEIEAAAGYSNLVKQKPFLQELHNLIESMNN
ncbi:tetratricopeptide repeat protein [candidate division KSB1 bacterium]|nr:tetratricopeptide repeat protein [candidate division KSB1 bacterium]